MKMRNSFQIQENSLLKGNEIEKLGLYILFIPETFAICILKAYLLI